MRVNPYSVSNPIDSLKSVDSQRSTNKASEIDSIAKPEGDGVARSGELSRLLSLLSEAPEVRDEVINEVKSRYEAGELNTPHATQDSAAAMIELERSL